MIETPSNTIVTVASAKRGRPARSKRVPAPSAKARENQAIGHPRRAVQAKIPSSLHFRNINDSDSDYEDGDGNDSGTVEELLELVRELKQTIDEQSSLIREAQTELKELKEEQQCIKGQNNDLKDEVCTLRDQVTTLSGLLPPTESWASIAAKHSGAHVAQLAPHDAEVGENTLGSYLTSPAAGPDAHNCTIDTSRVAEEDANKISLGAIRAIVEDEIRATNGQTNWRCRAVTRDARNTSRIKIACRDESEQRLVTRAAETRIAAGVRVLRDDLYPIKIDNVNRLAVLDEQGDIRAGAAEALGHENETTVAKIGWLSQKNVPKAYGSMVVYVTKDGDARRLLREGYFHVAGESGYTRVFERRTGPKQCYNCQEIGHKAYQCKNAQKCARCASGGHRHSECTDIILKCIPCGGPHESFSRNCRKLYPSQHE